MRVVADSLSLRWYIGYDLHESVPDHSSLTKIRERYGLEAFRRFFDAIVERCIEAGLVWGKELYFDATKVEANASLDSVGARFAIEAHLAELFSEQADQTPDDGEPPPRPLPIDLPDAVLQELDDENASRHEWIAEEGRQDRDEIRGEYRRVSDYRVSATDPDASMMPCKAGLDVGYHDHYAVDGWKARIILQVLVTPSEVMENTPMLDLLWRSCFRWKLRPHQVTGDTTYGTIKNIVALEDAGIRAYVPLPNFDSRSAFFGRSEFRYDVERDVYECPGGEVLPLRKHKYTERTLVYKAPAATCNACPLKARCTDSSKGRHMG